MRLSVASLAAAALSASVSVPAAGQAVGLPADAAREMVEGVCTTCHDARPILRSSGYARAEWRQLIATMVDLSGTDDRAAIENYLASHFPPNKKRAAQLVPGSVRISLREWNTPTLGQRSRDPVEAPDGSIWWAGQWGNLVGRIDPKTGAMKEYPLPANAMPHSVNVDGDGNVWYTGNRNGTIGKLDPRTAKITEYRMPDPAARDPHTAEFHPNGKLYFTLQQSNMAGRLDPATGEISLVTLKSPRAKPYGIKIDAAGALWIACNGSNCLVRMDPETLELREFKLPHADTHVRRLDIAADGMIWYVNSGRGRLGRFDPRTGEVREWPSPSGPKSHPYAIAVINGVVWYNESGVRPDALVRFEPRTETFQSWPIPSGGVYSGILRHMRPTRDGRLLIHQSATNRIIEVTIADGTTRE